MEVEVEFPLVGEFKFKADKGERVEAFKRKVCGKLGIAPELTLLLEDGKPISEDGKLENLKSGKLTVDYLWARYIPLWGVEGQETLKNSRVLLVGAGALGNETAKNLAMMGVGGLVLVDYDKVELSNLSRMVFFSSRDVGEPKSLVLAERLKERHPYLKVEAYQGRVEDLPLGVFLNVDVIVSGVDNVASRIFLSTVAVKYGIPMVDGGMNGPQGRVQVYASRGDPCPACSIPPSEYKRLVGLRNPCSAPAEPGTNPSLPTVTSLVSSIQAQETVKILLSRGRKGFDWKPLKGILLLDLKFNRYTALEVKRNPNCVVCGKNGLGEDKVEVLTVELESCGNSVSKLLGLIKVKAKAESAGEASLFLEDESKPVKIPSRGELSDYKVKRGSVIRAIFKNLKQEDYKEVAVKII